MTRNTIVLAYLLICLFITYASGGSYIRQFTDEPNTTLQQEVEARPNQNLAVAHYLQENQERSSRDYKFSASNAVKGLRDRPPSTYSLTMESFNTLLKSTTDRYESRPFAAGGYNWRLVLYPNGNKKDSGSGYLSLYVAIDDTTPIAARQEVYADLRFYIFNKNERKYFTIQDIDVWRFSASKKMWGFSQVLSVDTFKDPKNGYLYDGDNCEFGVDVTVPSPFEIYELFSVLEVIYNQRYKWTIKEFSTQFKAVYLLSDKFRIGGINWFIQLFPNGAATGEGKALSIFILLNWDKDSRPYDKIYVRGKIRVLNQRKLNDVEKPLDVWYTTSNYGQGEYEVIPFSDLRDPSKGFLVDDVLMVEFELEAISSTKYLSS